MRGGEGRVRTTLRVQAAPERPPPAPHPPLSPLLLPGGGPLDVRKVRRVGHLGRQPRDGQLCLLRAQVDGTVHSLAQHHRGRHVLQLQLRAGGGGSVV